MATCQISCMRLTGILLVIFSPVTMPAQDYLAQPGIPSFTTSEPVEAGFINLANGNLHLEIPLASYPQRGSLGYSLVAVYDSRIWKKVGTSWQPTNVPNSQAGWRVVVTANTGTVTYTTQVSGWESASHLQRLQMDETGRNGHIFSNYNQATTGRLWSAKCAYRRWDGS